jgi:chromosomal replication initiator protein
MFTSELVLALQDPVNRNSKLNAFRTKYRDVDVLLIDDIQFIEGKDATQLEFFHTFNTLYLMNKQIVISSDRHPNKLRDLDERLTSRIKSNIMADIQPPDFETRVAIIKRKAQAMNIDIPNDVAEYIANRLKTNIRQLEGVVKKLKAYMVITESAPSIIVAQTAIREILSDEQPIPVTVDRIISEVARTYGVSPEDIRSKKRSAQISYARQIAIYIVREITQISMSSIGEEFGGRDHSTMVYAIQQVEKLIKKDPRCRDTVGDIINNIREK